ncbi:hypothetical protein XENORESO_020587 [Xenotaenia resolanae]|uniref:C-type lectin domain-containing protein n=1 Tax=Xenotaenia resolanae TaxID=208358 RepID=A0ABV0WQ61_9TELE
MKILTLPLVLFALLALSKAADPLVKSGTEKTVPEQPGKVNPPPQGLAGNVMDASGKNVAKRATSCPGGWTFYNHHCYLYISAAYTWAQAENYCVSQGGNLASVHSSTEYDWLKSFIYSRTYSHPLIWIGGSDAQQEGNWFWSDGSRFSYKSWCSGMPRTNNGFNCILMNYSDCKCWLDYSCSYQSPFVCVRK